ncbi:glucosaminidase domain and LysM peptidoglycan-binding domain-containing protein [Pedobacter nyackensis]|uniref:Peptidoglycan hydrolase n=1 Tax=Pedobacter nyackensis TaxID=475255 RepID=A0A1W2BM90_9SPHI|nr:glucosaminidase domain-containing protein [Pedobacter nyackensis]SMC73936.1 Flagellum-specific peptidoglycan hydrolase FlgJ [Pedobacter nyackensis]
MIKKVLYIWLFVTCYIFSAKAQTTENYISDNAELAQTLMREHNIPASIILAVAIHESASGTSKIARYLNNHFGIKGANSNTEIRSSYRDYPTISESYNHFLEFLKSRASYSKLFDKYDQYDYKNWAKGIQRGGYARSRSWASQIIGIIKKNDLVQYDERPDDYIEPVAPQPVASHRSKSSSTKTYTVKRGDNLHNIAKARRTTPTAIMKKNGLKSAALKPGQKLKL